MTFEEACKALGYAEPPRLAAESREVLVEVVEELSENGTKDIEPGRAGFIRAEVEMFG